MSTSQQQCFLDVISRETEKLMNLKKALSIDQEKQHHIKKVKDRAPFYANDATASKERTEQREFEAEIDREAQEKNALLQAVINDYAESGHPLPPSMIKLMHSNNGKK